MEYLALVMPFYWTQIWISKIIFTKINKDSKEENNYVSVDKAPDNGIISSTEYRLQIWQG